MSENGGDANPQSTGSGDHYGPDAVQSLTAQRGSNVSADLDRYYARRRVIRRDAQWVWF